MFTKELLHSPQVTNGESTHIGERGPQVGGQPLHDRIPPTGGLLFLDDGPPNIPVQQDQAAVDRAGGEAAGVKDAFLQRGQEGWIIRVGKCLRHGCVALAIILLNSLSTLALNSAWIR